VELAGCPLLPVPLLGCTVPASAGSAGKVLPPMNSEMSQLVSGMSTFLVI
jgi:hypothetical protein